MSARTSDWQKTFTELFQASVKKYRAGHEKATGLVDAAGAQFLTSIGYTEQEFFDFIDDFCRGGAPLPETAMAIAAVRRDYFLEEQQGKSSTHTISVKDLPAKDAQLEGIGWLPRLISKAEAKLKGEMPPELMYCCGGDRKFFTENKIDPAEFLRLVWKTGGNPAQIAASVKKRGIS